MAKKISVLYLCESCGNEFSSWSGKCPMCGEWNSLKEIKVQSLKSKAGRSAEQLESHNIAEIEIKNTLRLTTGISEFDRVMGGGIVAGSITLIGGEPGIGKSTLLLQVAAKMKKTFYFSAEESVEQISIRAKRLKLDKSDIILASAMEISNLESEVNKINPDLIIIDSIQTVYLSDYDATPGSLVQVRECGIFLQQFAKRTGLPIIIIGHVTKEGNIAGPRMLEHLVDTVLYLEGERYGEARILRDVKNRFGATNEVGIFAMVEDGLVEVKNPSELFLSERKNDPGSVVAVTMEGTRPILIEIQALVSLTRFGYPKRASSGFDLNRLNLLAAVISKKTNIDVSNFDIYLNVIGGIKISEPAVDLAVCAAIISSIKNKPYSNKTVFIGEVGLLGETRTVVKQEYRKKEAKKMGYQTAENINNISDLAKLLSWA